MTDYDESKHPRVSDGTYTVKPQSAPEASLEEPREALLGERVMVMDRPGQVIHIDNGTLMVLYPNGDKSLETRHTALAVDMDPAEFAEAEQRRHSIESIVRKAKVLAPSNIAGLTYIARSINDGAWGDARQVAYAGLRDIQFAGLEDLWLLEAADEVRNASVAPDATDHERTAVGAAQDAAWALAARHLIGSNGGWTQDSYDHLTRPWRETMGEIHEDDAPICFSRDVARYPKSEFGS